VGLFSFLLGERKRTGAVCVVLVRGRLQQGQNSATTTARLVCFAVSYGLEIALIPLGKVPKLPCTHRFLATNPVPISSSCVRQHDLIPYPLRWLYE